MSGESDGEGLAEVFVKGAVFTLGAAAAGLVLRKVFRREPEVIVLAVAADELGLGGRGGVGEDAGEDDELEVDLEEDDD